MQQMNEWINTALPGIVDRMEKSIGENVRVAEEEGLTLSGRHEIYAILDDILSALFPNAFSREKVPLNELNFFLGDVLRHVTVKMRHLVREILEYHCIVRQCERCGCDQKAAEIVIALVEKIPEIRAVLMEDIAAALRKDPAAQSAEEILLSYPYIEAVATYRIAHTLWELKVPIVPRIMSERAHSRTGIDIHPGATIGHGFFIDHGTGVVIGETCIIGSNVQLYQGVTLGALSPFDKQGVPLTGKKRHPDIEDDVIIYANATILGGSTVIGKGSVIGGNTWITTSIPPGSKVYRGGELKVVEKNIEYFI